MSTARPAPIATVQPAVSPTPTAIAPAASGPTIGIELDEPRERADQQPVRLSVEPEGERQQHRDEHHEQELAAHEGAELHVDEHPRVARHPPVLARQHRLHERDRGVALEDPVGADREHEQDPDEDLEQRLRHGDRGVEEAPARRELPEPLVDRAQDLVPDPVRVVGGVVELRTSRSARDRSRGRPA